MTQALVITGMHRSGTSLAASLLAHAGVHVGEELLPGERGNPRGLFEDRDFLRLQDGVLHRTGVGIFVEDRFDIPVWTDEETAQAKALVETKSARRLWGWKDPRSSLFLEHWKGILHSPRWLLVYRHPVSVVLSFLRRGVDNAVLVEPLAGVRTWKIYNQLLLDFYRAQPEDCFLCDAEALARDIPRFLDLLRDKLELELASSAGAKDLYEPSELHALASPQEALDLLEIIDFGATELYRDLQLVADLPAETSSADPRSERFSSLAEILTRAVETLGSSRQVTSSLFGLLLTEFEPTCLSRAAVDLSRRLETAHHRRRRPESS